jgi:hypothetical protein
MDNTDQYEINTGQIFVDLSGNWKKFDRTFLKETVQAALEYTLRVENIVTVTSNRDEAYLENYRTIRYPRDLEIANSPEEFPFPDYFLKPDQKTGLSEIINFSEECILKKDSHYFDLFFALQFSLTEILDGDSFPANEFLGYHLKNTFQNDAKKYTAFLDIICLKYTEFLGRKHEPIVKRFLAEASSDSNQIVKEKGKLKWKGAPSQFGYLFLELARQGFIELPSTNGEASYRKYSQTCFEMFEFENKTTAQNLEKEMNPGKNTLSDTVRNRFIIPDFKDISKNTKK